MAEGVGFEPTVRLPARQFSRLEPSTTRPPFLHQIESLITRVALPVQRVKMAFVWVVSLCSACSKAFGVVKARSLHPSIQGRVMKQQANLIRAGQVIEHDGRRWTVLKQQIITPGKGGAFIQVEMRDLKTGNKTNERWRTADSVERLMTEDKEYLYSYTDGESLVLMDPETFEQTMIPVALLGDQAPFLQDNMTINIHLVEGDPVGIDLPPQVTLEVVEADPVVKGQTASSSYKPAKLSNGVKTMVPPFIEAGERIVVRTEDGSYVERAKD